jgi:Helix-turn-helix domain
MPSAQDLVSVARAAGELGISPAAIRDAIRRGTITPVRVDGRTNMIAREEVERYRREHLGRRGKRMQPAGALTEQQRKQRVYQHAYYQRRKAARTQEPAKEPAEKD